MNIHLNQRPQRTERPPDIRTDGDVPGGDRLDMALLHQALDDSLDVLRDTYAPVNGTGGGWYHELARPEPGTTATALGLLAFTTAGRPFEHFDAGLAFLAHRQVDSTDPLRDGGWTTKTSLGMPVVEATAWIARFLAVARCDLRPDAPDLRRAYRWLLNNQNPDGGWGSLSGAPSRTWLTCLALRALARLNPYDPAVERGVEWLTADRTALRPGWGPTPAAAPTVAHTAFALVTLAEARPRQEDERLLGAYDWLAAHLDPSDGHTWIETYDVMPHGPAAAPIWRMALWHSGLPLAVAALVHDPRGAPGPLLGRAVRTLLTSAPGAPSWPGHPGDGPTSLWTLWWRLDALIELARMPLARSRDVLHWLPDATVVQRAHARDRSLPALLPRRPRVDPVRFVRRYWSSVLLGAVVAGGLGGVLGRAWGWREFWLSVIIPMAMTTAHESLRRRRTAG
ncbi:prenyltransferase/squalene oxidase repeat-containing protein [Actinomadura oligospora]|uniref:prenyltransferase/squalene oxidase repeat-containing protein n=1 Tax=Actinomadura oligospora TaxID=111804 RepID=UPI00047D1A7D|nr:prenyltransferase/squalene oxidase repeat-containing protein [Actinomadura oligospora]